MKIAYSPGFVRKFKKLDPLLQKEVIEKIELFKRPVNHKQLDVHKLHGPLAGAYSFAVNYRVRIIFDRVSRDEFFLTAIGDHDVYK